MTSSLAKVRALKFALLVVASVARRFQTKSDDDTDKC